MCQDSVWITFKVYALSLAALEERPITWRLQLAVPAEDDELRKQVEKFIDYGGSLSMPPGTVSGFLDLPGGLGGEVGDASLQVIDLVEPPADGEEAELAIAMLEPDSDAVIASTTIKRTGFTRGQGGGVRSVWVDQANLFTIEMLVKDTQRRELTWNFQAEYDLTGRRPADIVDSLKFMAAMHVPNRIGIGLPFGPKEFTSGGTAPYTDRDVEAKRWARIAECLTQIQDHVSVLLKMPAEMTKDQAIAIIDAATLLSGETRTGTIKGTFKIVRNQTRLEPQLNTVYEFITVGSLKITVGSDEIPVGKQAMFFRGKYVEITEREFTIEPLSEYVSARYVGEMEVGHVFGRRAPATADEGGANPGGPDRANSSAPAAI